jgi:tryptophan 2,3-dioxygenase
MSITYESYLKVRQLIALQQVQSDPPEHDETLFIIIHQVYELWFKLLLHELDRAKTQLSGADLYGAIDTFQRTRTVMKTLVGQLDILETMTPMGFESFRDRLESASGFQSAQFREFEFTLGYKRLDMLKFHEENPAALAALTRRLHERSVVDCFYDFLSAQGVLVPAELTGKAPSAANVANAAIQEAIIKLYHDNPGVGILFELMTDFDEGIQEWRYRHVKMVERTIGMKPGTGGSSGAEFLRATLFHSVFPDLWAVRHRL